MNQHHHHLAQGMNVVTSVAGDNNGMIMINGMQTVTNSDGTMQILLNGDYQQQHQQPQQYHQDHQNQIMCTTSSGVEMMMDNSYDGMVAGGMDMGNEYMYQMSSFDNNASNNATDANQLYELPWEPQDDQQQSQMMWSNQTYIDQTLSEPPPPQQQQHLLHQQQQQQQPSQQQIFLNPNHAQVTIVSPPNGHHHQMMDTYHHRQQPAQSYNIMSSQMQQAMPSAVVAPQPIAATPPRSNPSPMSITLNQSPVSASPLVAEVKKGKKRSGRSGAKGENKVQKPVSAYALFFRDTQAAIKAENPSVGFGDVSKIVASRWDGLDKTAKDVYKERADVEKKTYMAAVASSKAKEVAEQHLGNIAIGGDDFQQPVVVGQLDYRQQESPNLQTSQQQQQMQPQSQPNQSQQANMMQTSEPMIISGYDSSNQMSYINSYGQHQQMSNHLHLPGQPTPSFAGPSMDPIISQGYVQNQYCPDNGASTVSGVVPGAVNNELGPLGVDGVEQLDLNNLIDGLDLDEENINNLFGGSGGILSPNSGLDALGTNDYLNDLNTFADSMNLEVFGNDSNENVFPSVLSDVDELNIYTTNNNVQPPPPPTISIATTATNSVPMPSVVMNYNIKTEDIQVEKPHSVVDNSSTNSTSSRLVSAPMPAIASTTPTTAPAPTTTTPAPTTTASTSSQVSNKVSLKSRQQPKQQQEQQQPKQKQQPPPAPPKAPKVSVKIKLNNIKKGTANSTSNHNSSKSGKHVGGGAVEAKTNTICTRLQCNNKAIESKQWEGKQYCSEECCVRHCSEVFRNWTQEAKNKNGTDGHMNHIGSNNTTTTTSSSSSLSKTLHSNQRVSTVVKTN